MHYNNTSAQVAAQERAFVGLMVAGVMFVVGYTLVRVNMAQSEAPQSPNVITNVVPHEATLWSDGFQ